MDSLTQIVLGAAVGEAVLGRKIGNKAMLYGAIAGTIPDLDSFAPLFVDNITAIEIHRGFTHSILFSIIFAPIFGWLISKIEKKANATWKDWSWLMFFGFITHPLLDAHTTWGTQLFWPLDLRLAYKNIFVIDPLYTIPFLVFLILAMRKKRTSESRRKLNNLGLIISSVYLLLITPALKAYAYFNFKEALEQQEITYLDIQTRPAPFNTILWSANVETENEYLIADYSILDTQPINFRAFPKNYEALGDLKDHPDVERLKRIAEGWYIIVEEDGKLFFNDLRFGIMNPSAKKPKFAFSYELILEDGKLTAKETEKLPADAKQLLANLMERIQGN